MGHGHRCGEDPLQRYQQISRLDIGRELTVRLTTAHVRDLGWLFARGRARVDDGTRPRQFIPDEDAEQAGIIAVFAPIAIARFALR